MGTGTVTAICGTHRRRVILDLNGPGPRFRHAGPGDGTVCQSERFTVRWERQADRETALAALAAEDEHHA